MTAVPALRATVERPQLHFTPARNWMNDPNGLVFVDGVYHLYFQCNPYGMDHAGVSWGHATSTDLVRWTEQPLAIAADDHEHVFSGSVVVDHANTSGFAHGDRAPLVALYTSAYQALSPHAGYQAQSIAVSIDGGYTWTKYAGNPVLDRGSSDFRDPKVFRYDDGHRSYWVMVAVEARRHEVVLYRSDNLLDWDHLSTFGPANATGGVWECPDLFELPIDGDDARTRWVLTVNLVPGGPSGGSAGQYFIGRFDGATFVPDSPTSPGVPADDPRLHALDWLDWGRDYYAAVSFDNTPGRRLAIGWMCNWQYAAELPTHPWHSSMTLPRELALTTVGDVIRLVQRPVAALRAHGQQVTDIRDRLLTAGSELSVDVAEGPFRLALAVQGASWSLALAGGGDQILIGFDVDTAELRLDRRAAATGLPAGFGSVETVRLPWAKHPFDVEVYVDRWSVEIFAAGGTATITDLVFPRSPIDSVEFSPTGECMLHRLTVTEMSVADRRGDAGRTGPWD